MRMAVRKSGNYSTIGTRTFCGLLADSTGDFRNWTESSVRFDSERAAEGIVVAAEIVGSGIWARARSGQSSRGRHLEECERIFC